MCKKNIAIKEANEELLGISAEEEERRWQRFYDNGDLELRLTYSEGVDAGREEGRTIGLEEGHTIGLEEGRTIGLEEGHTIGLQEGEVSGRLKALIEQAKKMLTKKYSIDEIKELTGLSEKQINELAQSI